jgi:hypothetical protein
MNNIVTVPSSVNPDDDLNTHTANDYANPGPIPDFLLRTNLGCAAHPKSDPIEAGQQAWSRLKSRSTWADWKTLGAAIAEGRTEAMARARTNEPTGRRYNTEFGNWLAGHDFGDLEATTRKRLLQCMEQIDAIEAWLKKLEIDKRLKLNHPTTVLSAWKRSTAAPKAKTEVASPDHTAALRAAWEVAPIEAQKEFLAAILAMFQGSLSDLFGMMPEALQDELLDRAESSLAAGSTTKKQREAINKARRNNKKKASPKYLEATATHLN